MTVSMKLLDCKIVKSSKVDIQVKTKHVFGDQNWLSEIQKYLQELIVVRKNVIFVGYGLCIKF